MDKFFLKILTDLECSVVIDGEFRTIAKPNTIVKILLNKGEYWVQLISIVNTNIRIEELVSLESEKIYQARFPNISDGIRGDGLRRTLVDSSSINVIPDSVCQISACDLRQKLTPGVVKVRKGNKWGCVNSCGEEIVPCEFFDENLSFKFINDKTYDEVEQFQEGLAVVCDGGRYKYIDKSGNETLQNVFLNYDSFAGFHEGYAGVSRYGKVGFIDKTGKEVIPCIFDGVKIFINGYVEVKKDGKWGFVSNEGKIITPFIYDWTVHFREDRAIVVKDMFYGYIDTSGNEVIECLYDKASSFQESVAAVCKDGLWGYIDKFGNIVIQPMFAAAFGFSEGLAPVQLNDKWGYIDKLGRIIIPFIYDMAYEFKDGMAEVRQNGKRGYIDNLGKDVFPCMYDNVSYSEGFVCMKMNGKWGYADKFGILLTPFIYNIAYDFKDGLAVVVGANDKCGCIDITGKEVIPCLYDGIVTLGDNVLAVNRLGKWTYIIRV